ncbi:hypothetical protein HAX54_005038, partial [Datura stramonium]|nr:hypothetical protein [Datura stramonium]
VGVKDARNEFQLMDALPCARHKGISATTGTAPQHHPHYAMHEARNVGIMPSVRRPSPLRVGRYDATLLQSVRRHKAAHFPRDKACNVAPVTR